MSLKFEDFLRGLEEPTLIVMDNASYHSRTSNRFPTMSAKKEVIQNFMKEHDITFNPSDTKQELISKLKDRSNVSPKI